MATINAKKYTSVSYLWDDALANRMNPVELLVYRSNILGADGRITNIRSIRGLPDGLTEKAIEAAQKIRFQPATKNGQPVSVRGKLEFSFNLY